MKNFSVVIADSCEAVRRNIQQHLKIHDYFDPIALAFNADEARDICINLEADVLFINPDITIDFDNLNIVEQLPACTHVIYLSNSDIQAIDAFELDVTDYLITPVTPIRFQKCINKLLKRLDNTDTTPLIDMQNILNQMQFNNTYKEPVIVKDSGRIRIIDTDDILWIGGAGNYVELHLQNEERPILHRETLASMQEKLTYSGFIRIHRSAIVKKQCISELKPTENGDYLVTLKNGATLNLSRRYKQSMSGILS
ncbi:LytTR family DNA-binding domain-containing protein [Pseudoalteromonas sp. C2R02]|uniref:LytR/AlgR family response regulator transcription factor n=1 Tax=Pseudoalteromonas sp. C2R02 TaxID=2841565 RepID=UPI001C09B62D|nr:LytTR family DNA-binding domain-containing protein [Pseudoalteromonas sp. C2R02]MBU2967852.1 LytTR family DNA-binding domain-containing protein [Pseudoalteromonas sp. C2R02]